MYDQTVGVPSGASVRKCRFRTTSGNGVRLRSCVARFQGRLGYARRSGTRSVTGTLRLNASGPAATKVRLPESPRPSVSVVWRTMVVTGSVTRESSISPARSEMEVTATFSGGTSSWPSAPLNETAGGSLKGTGRNSVKGTFAARSCERRRLRTRSTSAASTAAVSRADR